MNKSQKPNHLINATSPYLLQHAYNPVMWYQWEPETLNRAKKENKLIFLSVGYSACHWCHVMAHESFENDEIAAIMNESFINIKVDREERPDIDEIYMTAVQMMTGSGGWPMSVFLTPELKPFYGGTYFPPQDNYGRPGFKRILLSITEAWKTQQAKIIQSADEISNGIAESVKIITGKQDVNADILENAYQISRKTFDKDNGGFGRAPKFPHAMELSFLLRYYKQTQALDALEMVDTSLAKMADGGIYDQLGGGFHRYSTDEVWLAPHFEKMLYDQALLVRTFAEAFQITGNPLYSRIVRQTLDYVLSRMTADVGGFYSAEDADSEGKEGAYYVWRKSEIDNILGPDSEMFCQAYDVSDHGNWNGVNILRRTKDWHFVARDFNMSIIAFEKKMAALGEKVLKIREKRIPPGLDDKILTDWNSLMISAFTMGYKILRDEKYLNAAKSSATFLKTTMFRNSSLLHSYRNGKAVLNAYLSDYAFLISALLDIYSLTFEKDWLKWAIDLVDLVNKKFTAADGGYYFAEANQEHLIARSKNPFDNALPSGNSIMVRNLVRLAEMTGEENYRRDALKSLKNFSSHLRQHPQAYSEMLIGLDYVLNPSRQIVIAGKRGDAMVQEMNKLLQTKFLPRTVVVLNDETAATQRLLPMVEGKTSLRGATQAYLCENFTCKQPVSTVKELHKLLEP